MPDLGRPCHLRVEVLDNRAKPSPLALGQAGARLRLVIEVPAVGPVWRRLGRPGGMPPPRRSWGARLVEWRDPDGNPVAFLEWLEAPA